MTAIHLYHERPYTDTHVPNDFIDKYMPEANGEFVKVYLYLLRIFSANIPDFSISKIADAFNHTENDVIRALNYWERQNLLILEYDSDQSITGIRLLEMNSANTCLPSTKEDITASKIAGTSENPLPESSTDTRDVSAKKPVEDKKEYTLDEIKVFRQNPDLSELLFIIETYLKHPLTTTDVNTILYWYDTLSFPTDLIEYLVEYCITKGHSSTRYMDKVAIAWKEEGITTVSQAKESAALHSQVYYGVIKALGISGRNLVEAEQKFIRKWTDTYKFNLELIQEACSRTITAIHQPSFEYVDGILTNWHQNQVTSLKDIKNLDDQHEKKRKEKNTSSQEGSQQSLPPKRNKFANFNQRDYDYDQLENLLLNSSVQ